MVFATMTTSTSVAFKSVTRRVEKLNKMRDKHVKIILQEQDRQGLMKESDDDVLASLSWKSSESAMGRSRVTAQRQIEILNNLEDVDKQMHVME